MDVFHFDDIWSVDFLDLKVYGPENNRGYRYVLVKIDNISKFVGTVPVKNEIAQTIKNSFEKILRSSKRKPNLFETVDVSEFVNRNFTNLLISNNIKKYSGNISLGAVFAECFHCTIKDLLNKPIFQPGIGN